MNFKNVIAYIDNRALTTKVKYKINYRQNT